MLIVPWNSAARRRLFLRLRNIGLSGTVMMSQEFRPVRHPFFVTLIPLAVGCPQKHSRAVLTLRNVRMKRIKLALICSVAPSAR